MVVEDINCIPSGMELKSYYNVDMPICEGMNDIIYNNKSYGRVLVNMPADVAYEYRYLSNSFVEEWSSFC